MLRELSDLIRQQSRLMGRFGNLFFKFRDTLERHRGEYMFQAVQDTSRIVST